VIAVGEIDLASGPHLADVLREAQAEARHVVLDLGHTTFIDASGARILLGARARTRATSATFVVTGVTAGVKRLLTLLGAETLTLARTSPKGEGAGDGARADVPLAGPQRPRPLLRRFTSPQHG
jgi:anti-anti-sigma factor